jgi:exonuclease VII large subunit
MVLRNERWRAIVRDAAQVTLGDDLSIRLARGELGASVRGKEI